MKFSVVFSFRNEAENISELVRRVSFEFSKLSEADYELIFVNDASTDESLKILMDLRKNYPIKIINMSRNFGVTPCVLAGFSHSSGDAVIYMDADLQDPPELISTLIERFKAGADVVHTTRTHRDGETWLKLWLTDKAYKIINFFSDVDLPTNTGDYKLLSAKVVRHILELMEYDPYMRGLSIWVGYKQDYVYYRREARWRGNTKFSLFSKGPFREFIRGLTSFSAAPLYLSLFVGLITTIISVLLVFWAIITKIIGVAAPGTSGIIITISLFGGITLITNGIIGIYVAQIYYQAKGRPRYIIEQVIDLEDKNNETLGK